MQPRQREGTSKQGAKFFCENCHHEVAFNAEICPKCKKTFNGVKCPVCGHSGPPYLFQGGCPRCGYQAPYTRLGGNKETTVEGESRNKPRRGKSGDFTMPLLILLAIVFIGSIIVYSMNK